MYYLFLKSSIFWNITPCSQLKVTRPDISKEHVASIIRVKEISKARNHRERRWQAESSALLACSAFHLLSRLIFALIILRN
jgi:hypothetical protein